MLPISNPAMAQVAVKGPVNCPVAIKALAQRAGETALFAFLNEIMKVVKTDQTTTSTTE
jgi:hypothetical protein